MIYRLAFTERTLPPSLNSMMRWHWTRKKRLSDMWNRLVQFHVAGKKPAAPLTKAKLTLTRMGSLPLDWDNLAGSWKCIVDALRHNGIIADDRPENIGIPTLIFEKVKRVQVGVKVLVEAEE